MRITAQELENVLSRLPPAHKHGPDIINLAIQGATSTRPHHLKVPLRAELRVVTFRKMSAHHDRARPQWELEIS